MTVAQGINKITAIKKQIGLGIPATTNPIGTGTGYTTSIAGFPIGSTTIAIITGTGTVLAGDAVTFAGDTTVYRVYTGAAGAGNIVLEGTGLKVAIPAAATAMVIKTALFGAQILRRKTSIGSLKRATYTNDEIVNHQQSTGVNLGTASTDWQFDGLLSPGTYGAPMEAILRKNFTPVVGLTGLTLSITGTAPLFTVTRSTGSYLTDGIKIGDVVRITAGAFANAVNRDNNLLVTTVTALAITVITVNNSVLIAEAGIAASSITVMGKKSLPPITGHTDTLFTVEEWYNDLSKSELFPDIRIGQMDIGLPASGNATIKLSSMGLGIRTRGTAQVYASPNSSTTSPVLTSVRGSLIVNGTKTLICTGGSISIKANLAAEGPEQVHLLGLKSQPAV